MGRLSSILFLVLTTSACGSTSVESVVGPDVPKCAVTVTGPEAPIGAGGGPGTVTIGTTPECEWDATADADWITQLAPRSGQGSSSVQFHAAANPNGTARESSVTVNGQRAPVRQSASPCQFAATAEDRFPSSGGVGTITISAPGACPWTAISDVAWIVVSAGSGSGSASSSFSVAVNTAAERTGTITVGGISIAVTQAAASASPTPSCTVALTQSSVSMPAAGGAGAVGVTTGAGCPWAASALVPWITLTTASGTGSLQIGFTVAANSATTPRAGTITVGGATLTVNQAGTSGSTCTFTISPTTQSVAAAGGNINVAVSTAASCAWTATTSSPWVTVVSGTSGTGGGTVTLNAAANSGASRSGTATIGGQTFTVNQAGNPCTPSIAPSSITVGDEDVDHLNVTVTAQAGCAWTATSNANWVRITRGSSGTGSGSVEYKVDRLSGSSRSGTMTIAGLTFTVTQVQCSATLTPDTQAVPAAGGTFTVAITTQIGCPWQAVESLGWVSFVGDRDGAGSGSVQYAVTANTGAARTGTIAIAGQTLRVNQGAP